MGNIPPHEKVVFKSNFLHFNELKNNLNFIFRNQPIFIGDSGTFKNSDLKGIIAIFYSIFLITLKQEIISNNF